MTRSLTALSLLLTLAACRKETDTVVDLDGDGTLSDLDCDDTNAAVFPGAAEVCDGLDNDCDDAVDEDPQDAIDTYADLDGDGFGAGAAVPACALSTGFAARADDCDDSRQDIHPGAAEADCTDPTDYNCDGSTGYADEDSDGHSACEECDDSSDARFPGNPEVCDDLDNDCDSSVDEDATDAATWYADLDGDGFGNAAMSALACEAPSRYVSTQGDCDDLAATAYPGGTEVCDAVDNNCDGSADNDATDATRYYPDADGDQYGDSALSVLACEAPEDHVVRGGDCDEDHASAHPGGVEVCDGLDNDCDGSADDDAADRLTWYADADADGFGDSATAARTCAVPEGGVLAGGDCDDANDARYPGNSEICDTFDNDCDSQIDEFAADARTWYADADGDQYGDIASATLACAQPAATATVPGDCDDADADVYPSADEVCDAQDNDCNGRVDEAPVDADLWYRDLDRDGYAGDLVVELACEIPEGTGWYASAADCDDVDRAVNPAAAEACNGYDDDCDAQIDEDNAVGAALRHPDLDGDGFGDGEVDLFTCVLRAGLVDDDQDCDDTDESVRPERLDAPGNGVDDDCDGADRRPEIFVVERVSGALKALDGESGALLWSLGGLGELIGVSASEGGAVWISQSAAGKVSVVHPDHSATTVILEGLNHPYGLWWDGERLLVTEQGTGRVLEHDPSTGVTVPVVEGLLDPYHAVRIPGETRIFATQRGANALVVYDPATSARSEIPMPEATSSIAPMGADALYVSAAASGKVYLVTPSTGAVSEVSPADMGRPYGICGDPLTGDLIIPEQDTHSLARHHLASGLEQRLSAPLISPLQCATNALIDADEDGFVSFVWGGDDCDDLDASVSPSASETCADRDSDCDGAVDRDTDGDGFSDAACGGSDADDGNASVHPVRPWDSRGASCQAVLDAGSAAGDGLYPIDPDSDGRATYAYCDFTDAGEGWTLLIAADETSTYWGNSAPAWSADMRGATPSFLDGLDYHGAPYAALTQAETRLCYSDDAHCYTFHHSMNIPLQRFFTDGLSWVEFSYNSRGWADAGSSAAIDAYTAALGGFAFPRYSCQWLGINDVQSWSSIGLLSDGNGGCANMAGSIPYHDDGALGVGLQSCVDANGCPRGGTDHRSGQTRGVLGGDPSIGPWYVFGR